MKKSKTVKSKTHEFEGLPVVDADSDIVLNVTKSDVSNAKKKDPSHCAAAVACKRETKKDVRVFMSRMYVKEKKHWVRYLTPNNVSREITSFDRGSEFVPGEYIFKAATPGQKLGVHRSINHKETGKGTRRKQHITVNVRLSAKQR